MKLRIKGNSIRMRLTKSEISKMRLGEAVNETLSFGPLSQLKYSLVPTQNASTLEASFLGNSIHVQIPLKLAKDWAQNETVSLTEYQTIAGGEPLFILIEKDFFCLKPRTHEVEDVADMFENPNESHGSCG